MDKKIKCMICGELVETDLCRMKLNEQTLVGHRECLKEKATTQGLNESAIVIEPTSVLFG
jgi:hypothetical protein